jgi:hypothetical protein
MTKARSLTGALVKHACPSPGEPSHEYTRRRHFRIRRVAFSTEGDTRSLQESQLRSMGRGDGHALVIEQVIEFFESRREAERMLAEVVCDEPDWREQFRIERIELGSE